MRGYAGRQETHWATTFMCQYRSRIAIEGLLRGRVSSVDPFPDHEASFDSRVSKIFQPHAGNRSLEWKLASIRTSHSRLKQVTCSMSVKKLGPPSNLKWIFHPGERHGPNSARGPSVFPSCLAKAFLQRHLISRSTCMNRVGYVVLAYAVSERLEREGSRLSTLHHAFYLKPRLHERPLTDMQRLQTLRISQL